MAYQKIQCVCLLCDHCGETFQEFHNGFSIFVDENQAREYADNAGWYLYDYHYCPNCHTIDDEDNLIIKALNQKEEVK